METHNATVLSNLEEGDIVKFHRGLFSHYGVYIGNGEIVHKTFTDQKGISGSGGSSDHSCGSSSGSTSGCLCSSTGKQSDKGVVKKESFWTVAGNSKATKSNKDNERSPLPEHQIVENALSKIGCCGYNLLFSNCEHFAYWCRYGVEKSGQVDQLLTQVDQLLTPVRKVRHTGGRAVRIGLVGSMALNVVLAGTVAVSLMLR